MVEDMEESIGERCISQPFEAKCFKNRQSLVEFVHGELSILRTVSESLLDKLQHLF